MHLPLGTYSPDVRLGLVSASRNCFPRELSKRRTESLVAACGLELFLPEGDCRVIETKDHAAQAAEQLRAAGCDAAVLFLGNFSPEIEDAFFIKAFRGPVMLMAAAEESAASLGSDRGDALCGLLSAAMAVKKRGLSEVYIPQYPLVGAETGAKAIARFERVMKVVKGARKATLGLFGPRPRDFETCNYNVASLASIGMEVEELGFHDLAGAVEAAAKTDLSDIVADMKKDMPSIPDDAFAARLAAYEKAVLEFRDALRLSGMTSQCWSEQENRLRHVPCYINARMAARGFPAACENDAYSLAAELLCQYASDQSVTVLDINHSIPADLGDKLLDCRLPDVVGMFHCGNTDPGRLTAPEMKHQLIMRRLMEPGQAPDITRGTIEGALAASPITVAQVQGRGDGLRAYLIQGEFLNLDPKTFGCAGTANLPGFSRFYRHVLLGRFHHHAAVAFEHCGDILFDALKLLGVEEIFTPLGDVPCYPGENPFDLE